MRRAKTIDELYDEVKGYDYVLTNDAPLATALNAKIDDFRLGGFAYTPRTLASILESSILKEASLSELDTVYKVEHETLYDFRFIHSEIQNIKDIRRYTADVGKYLYSKRSRAVYDAYRVLPTTEKAMELYDPLVYKSFLDGKKVAVVGLELFDDLDKHMLPAGFDEIDPYTSGKYEIREIHAIGNDRQIAGSIVDLIDAETSNDTAIVLDSGGAIADAVRSALYRKKIPFRNSLDVKDLSQVRDFLQFLGLALDFDTVRIGDVRELFSVYQTGKNSNKFKELRPEDDNYLLCRFQVDDSTERVTRRLIEGMRQIRDMTFGNAMDLLFDSMVQKTSVAILLNSMKLTDSRITPELVGRLSYAVNNVSDLKHNEQVPEYEKKGVLLADCKKAVYVDRSFVIYIGLDDSWEVTAPGKDYVDKQKLDEDNAFRMGILLQQGTSRVYAVKPVTRGKETTPCTTFQTISALEGRPRNISSFADICTEYVRGSWFSERPVPETEHGSTGRDLVHDSSWKFSKSSYNSYCDCPIKYMFSRILPGEDNEYTVFGNCMHEFAEFYLCYPDIVRGRGLEYYVEKLDSMYAGISNECMREIDTSRFRVYLNNIARYIDLIRPAEVPLDTLLSRRKYPNLFMKEEGLDVCSTYSESEMSSDDPVFAKFDVCFGDLICDYKTGKPKTPKEIVDGFDTGGKNLTDTQALIYLSVLNSRSDAPLEFQLFFLGDNDIQSVDDGFDVRQNVRTVRLCTETLVELAMGPDGPVKAYAESHEKTYGPLLPCWDEVSDSLMRLADEDALDTPGAVELVMQSANLKPLKKNTSAAEGILKYAAKALAAKYVRSGDSEVLVPSDSMKAFIEELVRNHGKADSETDIPVYRLPKGKISCDQCSYRSVCLKAFADEEAEE